MSSVPVRTFTANEDARGRWVVSSPSWKGARTFHSAGAVLRSIRRMGTGISSITWQTVSLSGRAAAVLAKRGKPWSPKEEKCQRYVAMVWSGTDREYLERAFIGLVLEESE